MLPPVQGGREIAWRRYSVAPLASTIRDGIYHGSMNAEPERIVARAKDHTTGPVDLDTC
jgi:hypothetical protein